MKQFKPMLGANAPDDKSELNFPLLVSVKLDGIRAIFHPELGLVSRSLKPIPNKQLHEKYSHLIEYSKQNNIIFDGEFYNHKMTFQEITSLVMTECFEEQKTVKKLQKQSSPLLVYYYKITEEEITFENPIKFHIFDRLDLKNSEDHLINRASNYIDHENHKNIVKVDQKLIYKVKELDKLFNEALDDGYEGLIIRCPSQKYKFGRSTVKEKGLLKYKPFITYDAKITGITERLVNTNESFRNELGQSVKRNTKEDKIGTGIASAFIVKINWLQFSNKKSGTFEMRELKVTIPGTEEFRREIFENQDKYIGKMIEFKGMDVGAKDVPRHPVFERFREDRE